MYALTDSFVVLPDSPGGARAGRRVPYRDPEVVAHPSGRPWLVGRWDPERLTVAEAGEVRIAVFGYCPIGSERLAEVAARVREPADLDGFACSLPGSAHLLASVHGKVRAQGTLTGLRQVFTARLDHTPIASDRADVLAAMIGAEPDEDVLAVNIVCRQLVPPLSERSWWRGVQRVAPDRYLLLSDGGGASTVRWWSAPDPDLPLAEGALRVRDALREAVAWRKPEHGRLSADLSGGMDSTSLCFLAYEHTPDLLVFRRTEGSAINDDPFYAGKAAQLLERAEHIETMGDEGPPVFAPPYELPDTEAPHALTRGLNRMRYQIRQQVEYGATLHLAGHGGDELFTGSAAYLHTLIRRRPLTALKHLRVHRALGRWPLRPTVSALWRRQDLGSWWRGAADGLTAPWPPVHEPQLGWAHSFRATPWATSDAVNTARRMLAAAADGVVPLADDRGQHEAIAYLRYAGPLFRQLCREHTACGLRLDLPYLDDRVVEAALSVRTEERYDPWRYKPVLAAAMRGQVPDFILDRYTKGDCESDVHNAQQKHLPDLLDLFTGSELAARGVVDVDSLRADLHTPPGSGHEDMTPNLEMTIGCELWLREVAATRKACDPQSTRPLPRMSTGSRGHRPMEAP